MDKHPSQLGFSYVAFYLVVQRICFFLKGWCPRCDIFKLTQSRAGGSPVTVPARNRTMAEGQNCGFFLFLKVKRSCSKAARQLEKKREMCFFFVVVVCFFWWLGKKERQNNKKRHTASAVNCVYSSVSKYCITNHK